MIGAYLGNTWRWALYWLALAALVTVLGSHGWALLDCGLGALTLWAEHRSLALQRRAAEREGRR